MNTINRYIHDLPTTFSHLSHVVSESVNMIVSLQVNRLIKIKNASQIYRDSYWEGRKCRAQTRDQQSMEM